MKKLIFSLIFVFSLLGNAQNSQLFEAANEAYAQGDYQSAVSQYEQILANGETSVEVHFNLGNAYYKLSQIAPSIYHYEKALQLDPGNDDVRNNLKFAKTMAIDALGEEETAGFWSFFDRSTSAFSALGWAWVGIISMLGFVVLFLSYYFSRSSMIKRMMFIGSIFFLVVAISSAGIAYLKQDLQQQSVYGIVFSEEVEVKDEPSARASQIFMLHAGAKVKITQNFQEWIEIELPNGSGGWIEKDNLKRL